jgi:hypothetical protein
VSDDRLEVLRHELADVEAALEAAISGGEGAGAEASALEQRQTEIQHEIVALERAAREEVGVQPAIEGSAEEVAESRPASTELVVPSLPPGDERDHATLLVLDKHDEDQVLSQIEERMDKVLMYDFEKGGSRLVDLSVNGVFECVRLLNATGHARIRIAKGTLTVDVEPGEDGLEYVATVAAEDEVSGLLLYASAAEPKHMKLRGGKTKPDPFARQKAISKAQRNALKRHIPERLRQGMLALHRGDSGRVLEIQHGVGAQAAAALPAPVDTPEANALVAQIESTWLEIRKMPGWKEKMLPGVFNAKLSRARSSEVELRSFLDALESLRETLGEAA